MKFQNERSGKVVVVAHCVLNQNSRVFRLAHYPAVINEVVDVLRRHNVGFLQMPCPELIYAGVKRFGRTREEYDTPSYRKHCKQIAVSTANQIEQFAQNGIKTLAIVGIKDSPSCATDNFAKEIGILMEELVSELQKRGLRIPMYAISNSEIAADVKRLGEALRTV